MPSTILLILCHRALDGQQLISRSLSLGPNGTPLLIFLFQIVPQFPHLSNSYNDALQGCPED